MRNWGKASYWGKKTGCRSISRKDKVPIFDFLFIQDLIELESKLNEKEKRIKELSSYITMFDSQGRDGNTIHTEILAISSPSIADDEEPF